MQQPAVAERADPEATVPIAKQHVGRKLQSGRKWIAFSLSISQSCDSAGLPNQDRAVAALCDRVDAVRRIRHSIHRRWTRLPPPQARHRSCPEIASAILIYGGHS